MKIKRRKSKLPKPYYETELGKLYHGDCLQIMPELEPVDLVLTDPPYGMNNNTDSDRFSGGNISSIRRRGTSSSRFEGKIIGDDKPFNPLPFLKYPNVILFGYNHFAQNLPRGTLLV